MNTLPFFEYNFDGLIGPTHNFSGLAQGNLASLENRYATSSPKAAALQGLTKMKLLYHLGIKQGFIPPHPRPNLNALKQMGYTGSVRQILEKAGRKNLEHLLMCSSASAMWTANAATISPSCDTRDHRVHITPANLISQSHRAIEVNETAAVLKVIFFDEHIFCHHPPLKNSKATGDEGAANHMRLGESYGRPGIEVFVYGRGLNLDDGQGPHRYHARQSLEASQANAGNHQLSNETVVFARQNPWVIDQGVFHNDVIAVSNENVLLIQERAFADKEQVFEEIRRKYEKISSKELFLIEITESQLPVIEAVEKYLFNSQIVTLPAGEMALIAPQECRDGGKVKSLIDEIIEQNNPVKAVHFVNLHESMRNGGGPACLRLRMELQESEVKGIHPGFLIQEERLGQLKDWIQKHYRDQLHIKELRDYALLKQSYQALDELTQLLQCGSIYDFQKN